ncbi:energy transducer TonB [Mucilaginibacter flavus]|uniref:energy transducer TonB n=1 Tax=Mucilaginibacter flavus TaxID=931504 RepID=UPI0025B3E4E9|nr:energy transducer TonB [Mucilaginibacter flavus]MDN3579701.1 TonB family protein [Mucilaginibacter flavus]
MTKFNLYEMEWLDLVFDQRNKSYGAYELRQHYSRTMSKAMGLAFAVVAVWGIANFAFRHKPGAEPSTIEHVVDILPPPPPVSPEKQKQVIPPQSAASNLPKDVSKKINFPPPVVVPEEKAVDPPTTAELQKAVISNVNQDGQDATAGNLLIDNGIKDGPGGPGVTEDVSIHTFDAIEVLPTPDGGMEGWAKFLQKNLRYPAVARENNVQGRVILNFVVEKDGSISNIKVARALGSGLDEESVRVLKLAKPWKPGIQNGHPVRVAYSIPFNFQLAEGE